MEDGRKHQYGAEYIACAANLVDRFFTERGITRLDQLRIPAIGADFGLEREYAQEGRIIGKTGCKILRSTGGIYIAFVHLEEGFRGVPIEMSLDAGDMTGTVDLRSTHDFSNLGYECRGKDYHDNIIQHRRFKGNPDTSPITFLKMRGEFKILFEDYEAKELVRRQAETWT